MRAIMDHLGGLPTKVPHVRYTDLGFSLMRIDEAEAKRRLSSSRNLANLLSSSTPIHPEEFPLPESTTISQQNSVNVTVETIDRGARRGCANVPEFLRDTMGLLAAQGVPASAVAEAFEVSHDVVDRAKTGRVGGRPATDERKQKIQSQRLNIQDQALLKLMKSLDLINDDSLAECSAKELSGIATNLAKVASLSEEGAGLGNQTNVIVYTPALREEKKFRVLEV